MIQVPVTIAHGRITYDRQAFRELAHQQKDGAYTLTLQRRKEKRSSQANRRYWALLTCAAQELGYDDPEELHEGVAMKFLKLPDDERTGLERRLRTPNLNTADFAVYSERVERFFLLDLHLDLTGFYREWAA